jgi:S-formylglutathione hydrolase FrmB
VVADASGQYGVGGREELPAARSTVRKEIPRPPLNFDRVIRAVAVAALVGCTAVWLPASAGTPASPLCVTRTAPARAALTVTSWKSATADGRIRDYTLGSTALGGIGRPAPTHVAILLPPHYDPADTATRYPVLYLLHGHGGHYSDWTQHGIEALIGGRKMIVVMPDGGYDGWYSDWYGTDVDGHSGSVAPGWETYHVDELLPWVDRTFNTFGDRQGRAIAGLSMGGFGAMSYAARHPDLFAAAGAFSGAVDIDDGWPVGSGTQGLAANLPDRKEPDNCVWGDPATEDVVWRTHDPTELAGNLAAVPVSLWFGNGEPGDASPGAPQWSPGAGATEAGVNQENQGFIAALRAAGHSPYVDSYGAGIHGWFYWERDLSAFLGRMPHGFWDGMGQGTPAAFDYETAEPVFRVWGWAFSARRDVSEFTYLSSVTDSGFTVRGSGELTVTAPVKYRRGEVVTVTDPVTGQVAHPALHRAATGDEVTFTVDLGPSHSVQQYLFGTAGEQATFPTALVVSIRRALTVTAGH